MDGDARADVGWVDWMLLPERQRFRVVVAPEGAWFEIDDRPRVDLATRISLRRILVALARAAPTRSPLGVEGVFAAGWPGELALARAASSRVYTAIHTLRRLGLDDVIRRRSRGWVLLADVSFGPGGVPYPGCDQAHSVR